MSERLNQIWLVSHSYVCVLLDLYRENGFWFTGNKSWDLMKWNALGSIMISEKAIEEFLNRPEIHKGSKAINYGGGPNARCFVAEHVYPSKILKTLILEKYSKKNPSFEDFKAIFKKYNRLCYVWHSEDSTLRELGLQSKLPDDCAIDDLSARYKKAKINSIETKFSDGASLFKQMEKLRENGKKKTEVVQYVSNFS